MLFMRRGWVEGRRLGCGGKGTQVNKFLTDYFDIFTSGSTISQFIHKFFILFKLLLRVVGIYINLLFSLMSKSGSIFQNFSS